MTSTHKTIILTNDDILLKIERMAWQILEINHHADEIVLIGIEVKGRLVAELLSKSLQKISNINVKNGFISLNKTNPVSEEITISEVASLHQKHVILVDDVLNSGKTLIHACIPILKQDPASLHTAILANRDHASFPVKADIVGVSLATTLQEHITFDVDQEDVMSVYLQ